MEKQIVFLACILLSFESHSQRVIQGRVVSNQHPVPFATVRLLNMDSSFVKGVVTDTTGTFVLKDVVVQRYLLTVSAIGFQTFVSAPYSIDDNIDLHDLILVESISELSEVIVRDSRLMFEQQNDRLVINVHNSSTAAGNNVLELLQKSPGITVDRQNNRIGMEGRPGVKIMINNRLLQVSPELAMQMLEGMSASRIRKIEIIRAPSAAVDADGGGIIHVVTKENDSAGMNGSLNLTAGYRWAEGGGINASVQHTANRLSFSFDYSATGNHNLHVLEIQRSLPSQEPRRHVSVVGRRENVTIQQNLEAGLDWQIGPQVSLNATLTGYRRNWRLNSSTTDSMTAPGSEQPATKIFAKQLNRWQGISGGIDLVVKPYEHEQLTLRLDHLYYHNTNPSQYDLYTAGDSSGIDLRKITPVSFFVAGADYRIQSNHDLGLEFGTKFVGSTLNNKVDVRRMIDEEWTADNILTSHSILSESIVAGYASFDWSARSFMHVNGGVRYEHTKSLVDIPSVDRDYGSLFPSLSIKYMPDSMSDLQVFYSRRITRPNYNDIASYAVLWSHDTFTAPNTSLWPGVSNSIRLGYRRGQFTTWFQAISIDNEIVSLQPEVNIATNSLTFRSQNLSGSTTLTLGSSWSCQPSQWWDLQIQVMAQRQSAIATHLEYRVENDLQSIYFYSLSRFRISQKISAEVSGFYQSGSVSGISRYGPQGSLNIGVRYKNLSLSVDDALRTNNWNIRTFSQENNIDMRFRYDWYNRFIRITYSLTFGDKHLQSMRKRRPAEEERKRISN